MAKLPGELLKYGAPVLKGILENVVGGIGGRVAGAVVDELAAGLGVPSTKEDVEQAIENKPEEAAEVIRRVEEDFGRMAEAVKDATISYHDVLKEDARAESWLQSRWRPIFAVVFAISFLMITTTICRAVWLGQVDAITALAALTGFLIFLFSTGAAVLGVYVWRRSDEKTEGV